MTPARRLAAALAVALLVLITPGPAQAATSWPPVSICTEVDFTSGTVQSGSRWDDFVVTGRVRACPDVKDPGAARWSVARYETGSLGVVALPQPYGETDFSYQRNASADTWAICVVNEVQPAADPKLATASRVACLGPDPDPPITPLPQFVRPLVPVPVDDARFEAGLISSNDGPVGICAGCV